MDTSSISHTTHTVCHISKHELRTANRTGTRRGSFLVRCIVDQIALILNLWAWEAQAHFPVQMYSLDSSGNRNMYLSPTSVLSLFLVRPDTHTQRKYSKPRMHRKDKNKTQKRFPKNIQIMCRLSLMAFFSPTHCKHWCCRRLQIFLTNILVGPASSQRPWIWTRGQNKN